MLTKISSFYAPAAGYFKNGGWNEEFDCSIGMPYVLEKIGENFRFYAKDGTVSEFSDKGDEAFDVMIQKAVNDGLYKLIEFPSNFSSRNLNFIEFTN